MDSLPEITIQCQGHITVSLDELHNLQGDLKTLSEEDYVKLRNSIIEFGFSFPVFFWEGNDGKKWIIDAHQRQRTLLKMRDEGYTIPPLPADKIFAQTRKEAKKKLLLLNSRYGTVTDSGMADFLNEEGFEIPIEEMSDFLTFPEMSFETGNSGNNNSNEDENKQVTCPNCKTVFTP